MKAEDCFRIGSVLKTKGLKGEMQLYIDFEGIEKIKITSLFIDMAGKMVPYFVSSLKHLQKNQAYLFLEDVDTIEKANSQRLASEAPGWDRHGVYYKVGVR